MSCSPVDEQLAIDAAADLYEAMATTSDMEVEPMSVDALVSPACCEAEYDASDEHDGSDDSSRQTSSSSHDDDDGDRDDNGTDSLAVDEVNNMLSSELLNDSIQDAVDTTNERLSVVSLSHADDNDEARMPAMTTKAPVPMATMADISRKIMFTRYARAVPSAQERQDIESFVGSCSASSSDCIASSGALEAPMHLCCSVACQELSKWKDERIHELQRALDHMVDAMGIQQRDIAAQRAFLARQSEQLTKLSMTLHHEKLSLQLEKERLQRAQRAVNTAAIATGASSRPPTPSASSSRTSTPRGSSSSAKKIKGVFSSIAGSSSRSGDGRRSTASVIDEHSAVTVAPAVMTYSSVPHGSSFTSRSVSATQLATPIDSVRTALPPQHSSSLSVDLSDVLQNLSASVDSLTEVERSMSLSALDVRPTLPVASLASTKTATPHMSDVSLQDSPVRYSARSATNSSFVKMNKEWSAAPAQASESTGTSPSTASVASTPTSAPTSSANSAIATSGAESCKKPSLGERFRSLRWKA